MTRTARRTTTYVVAADGTRFVPEATFARRRRRILFTTIGVIVSPFLAAAAVGIWLGATEGLPEPTETLPKTLTLALKACEEVPDKAREGCIALYLRPAYDLDMGDQGASHTPAGPALVKECTDQYTDRDELTMCLTQGIAGDN